MGYVKGGPLENYRLRSSTHDENIGRYNTAHMEWISIKPGFWGENGGHILRLEFLRKQDVVAICMSQVMCTEML